MIIHLVSPDTPISGGTFLKMKGTVLDKIRADYNTEKRDRFVFLLNSHNHVLQPPLKMCTAYVVTRERQPDYLG